jgi:hypothetical protein
MVSSLVANFLSSVSISAKLTGEFTLLEDLKGESGFGLACQRTRFRRI